MKANLTSQVALVTGAARGIGQGIADSLKANGATVYYSDIDESGAMESANVTLSIGLHLDVTNANQVEQVFETIMAEQGRLDIVVNNAGVNTLAHRVNIDQFPLDEWNRILKVDLTGLFLVSRAAASIMVPAKSGRIINIASIAGLVPLRLQSPFVAAKAGVINLTKSMALELGPSGVLVNAIAPGSIMTEGTKKLFYGDDGSFHAKMQEMLNHVPLGRPGTVDEIAIAALFLADPDNTYMNGAVLTIDGGWTAGYARDF